MLPVSVVVPHIRPRWKFFQERCLPSILTNEPRQIIVESGEGGACEKRNRGAGSVHQPYLYFVDDDSILRTHCLLKLLQALEADAGAAFAYCDTTMVLYKDIPYPNPEGLRQAKPWSLDALYDGNYVETMSLFRRDLFPGFDSMIKRFQDWDLFLTMGAAGLRGIYVPQLLFELHHFDEGISATVDREESLAAIRAKHPLVRV